MRDSSGRFTPGHSGNPDGRPKGALNKSTLLAKALVEGQAEALMDRAVKNALLGLDPQLLRFLVQWLLPQVREEVSPEFEDRLEDLERRVGALEMQQNS